VSIIRRWRSGNDRCDELPRGSRGIGLMAVEINLSRSGLTTVRGSPMGNKPQLASASTYEDLGFGGLRRSRTGR
jgi:hypothetical protein